MARKPYKTIGLGGTFDHFHAGHQKFISHAASLGEKMIIGVTTPSLSLGKHYPKTIESFEQRQQNVIRFCRQQHFPCEVIALKDIFGPTLEKGIVNALCVTPETEKGAGLINQTRQQLGMRPLPVYICEYFLADDGRPLHAEDIRAGTVNRQGKVYRQLFERDLKLNQSQKSFFHSPMGTIRPKPAAAAEVTCVVGDQCLETFIKENWPYSLGVYDQKQQRQLYVSPLLDEISPDVITANPAGQISKQLVHDLVHALKHNESHVLVQGEEDLAAVALFLLLPLGATVYYGQPGEGMVEVVITEELKERVYQVLAGNPSASQTPQTAA